MRMIIKDSFPGLKGLPEEKHDEFVQEFRELLERYGLRMSDVKVDSQTGDLSFEAPDFPEYDTEVTRALLTFARNLEYTIQQRVELRVSVPEYGERGFDFLVVSDELG